MMCLLGELARAKAAVSHYDDALIHYKEAIKIGKRIDISQKEDP